MDANRFDKLVRSLYAPSRRALGSLALGGTVGAMLGLGTAEAKKKRKRKKKKCKSGTRKCGKRCIPSGNCCTSTDCAEDETCQSGVCSTSCEPQCDGKTCGDDGCGDTCGECEAGERCQDGQCACVLDCAGKSCGDDGCGGSCGTCIASAETCQQDQCVCGAPGKLGPGDTCGSAADCCPYSGEEICSKGAGFCETFLPVCRSGFGGRCTGNCDCLGELECRDGTCRCPGAQVYVGGGACCDAFAVCGDLCCPPFFSCVCLPFECRCVPQF